jgi:hypothetical protein
MRRGVEREDEAGVFSSDSSFLDAAANVDEDEDEDLVSLPGGVVLIQARLQRLVGNSTLFPPFLLLMVLLPRDGNVVMVLLVLVAVAAAGWRLERAREDVWSASALLVVSLAVEKVVIVVVVRTDLGV